MDLHSARSLRAGHSADKLEHITDFSTHPGYSPAERAALAYAAALTQTPVDVSDAIFAELQAHYDTAAIVEITGTAAIQNFNAKFNGALRVDVNAVCPLPLPGTRWPDAHSPDN